MEVLKIKVIPWPTGTQSLQVWFRDNNGVLHYDTTGALDRTSIADALSRLLSVDATLEKAGVKGSTTDIERS